MDSSEEMDGFQQIAGPDNPKGHSGRRVYHKEIIIRRVRKYCNRNNILRIHLGLTAYPTLPLMFSIRL